MAGIEAVTVSDLDVYRSAKLFVDRHGDGGAVRRILVDNRAARYGF